MRLRAEAAALLQVPSGSPWPRRPRPSDLVEELCAAIPPGIDSPLLRRIARVALRVEGW